MEDHKLEIARGPARRSMKHVTYGLQRAPSPPVEADADAATRAAARRDAVVADLWAWSQLLHPTACFTHLSSAIVRGWWLPRLPAELPVWITQIASQNPTHRRGARVIRTRAIPPSEYVEGLRLAVPAETLVSCAIDLALLDLMILVDSALHCGDVTLPELWAVAAEQRRGAPRLRQAIALADGRSESAMETVLRVLHVVCGIGVKPQQEVRFRGRFVARVDLWLVGTRTIHEYDGDQHLKIVRQGKDLRRTRRLTDAGVTRRGYAAADISDQPAEIIREACAATGRPFSPALLEPWWALWTHRASARLDGCGWPNVLPRHARVAHRQRVTLQPGCQCGGGACRQEHQRRKRPERTACRGNLSSVVRPARPPAALRRTTKPAAQMGDGPRQ